MWGLDFGGQHYSGLRKGKKIRDMYLMVLDGLGLSQGWEKTEGVVKGALNLVNGCRGVGGGGLLSASQNDHRIDREIKNARIWAHVCLFHRS